MLAAAVGRMTDDLALGRVVKTDTISVYLEDLDLVLQYIEAMKMLRSDEL